MDCRAAAGPEDAGPAPLLGSVTCTVTSGSGGLPTWPRVLARPFPSVGAAKVP